MKRAPRSPATRHRRLSPAALSRKVEVHALDPDTELIAAARRRFATLDLGEQTRLATQLADCARAEYTTRIRNVVQVASGMRRKRHGKTERLREEACVVFIVRRKPDDEIMARQPAQRLPRWLLTPALVDGSQQICAVPTDVQLQNRLLRAKAQGATAVDAVSPSDRAQGAIACTLRFGAQTLAVAPIHVLSPTPAADGMGIREGARVGWIVGATPTNRADLQATRWGGRLRSDPQRSFDVQLATIGDRAALAQAFAAIPLNPNRPRVNDLADLTSLTAGGVRCEIHVPANHRSRISGKHVPLLARFSLSMRDALLEYTFTNGTAYVRHQVLELLIDAGANTLKGDSGCPVLVPHDGAYVLVGMHIAGNENGSAFIIPAWDIVDRTCYAMVQGQLPAGSQRVVAP